MSFTLWRAVARRPAVVASILALGLAAIAGAAHAQQATKAQLNAIKSSCRSDYMANCMSVRPGGKEALQCLQSHVAKLSGACKIAVSATMAPPKAAPKAAAAPKPAPKAAEAPKPPPAPKAAAAAPKPAPAPKAAPPRASAATSAALNKACGRDYLAHCASVPPGGKAAVACLKRHAMALSVSCKRVLSAMMTHQPAPKPAKKRAAKRHETKTVVIKVTPPPAPPPAAAAIPMPTRKQMHALKFTCRRDFRAQCRGVPPGGQAAFACLVRHQRRLSPNCRTSVRAILLSAPAAAAPPPPAVPIARIESLSIREKLRIARACERDRAVVCPTVRPGGGRLFICLASHPAALSPRCGAALRRALY